jgi:hypothetical protein
VNLDGFHGVVTVTAYETDAGCSAFGQSSDIGIGVKILLDNAIAGAFTFAGTTLGAAFGNDALGLGLSSDGSQVVVPASQDVIDALDIQTFNPESVDASLVFLSHLRAQTDDNVIPNNSAITFSTTFYDTLEVNTSLPDTSVGCALFTSIKGGDPALIPANVSVSSSGFVRLIPISSISSSDYVYGIVGQAIGTFGASSSVKTELSAGSASKAFIDAPLSLTD